jgi:hypothetical protein
MGRGVPTVFQLPLRDARTGVAGDVRGTGVVSVIVLSSLKG